MSPRPAGPQAGESGRGPGMVLEGFWRAVGLLGSSTRFQRVLEELEKFLERFRRGFGRSMGGTASRAPGWALETHYIDMSRSFCFEGWGPKTQ